MSDLVRLRATPGSGGTIPAGRAKSVIYISFRRIGSARKLRHEARCTHREPGRVQPDTHENHSFGWSLLMARNLVASAVNLVQVNPRQQRDLGYPSSRFPKPQELPLATA
jgi:hypothetical protein